MSSSPAPDVFVSFRGPDTRGNFTSHLLSRLNQEGIRCFRDDAIEDSGTQIEEKISKAIRQAKFALVVFSEDYASSRCCLNELAEIFTPENDSNDSRPVGIPIFYSLTPTQVSELAEKDHFNTALSRLPRRERKKTKDKWKNALKKAKETSGYVLQTDGNGIESKLIDKIVERLNKDIHHIRPLYLVQDAVGVDDSAHEVISLLSKDGEDVVRWVGICGPEGIGKTTVAGVAFNKIRHKYECSVFLAKIGEARESERVDMQRKLLQKLGAQVRGDVIGTDIDYIKRQMRGKKLLLVLDGVTDEKQVDDFSGAKPFKKGKMEIGAGSRILITTRDPDLLNKLKVDYKYIVKGLSQDVALQLFLLHASKTTEQDEEQLFLCKGLSHYAGGHPSLLERLGSYVRDGSLTLRRKTLDKLVRSASSLSLRSPSVGLCGGQGGSAHHGASPTDGGILPVNLDCANGYRTPFDSLGADFGPSCCAYPFEFVGPFGVVDGAAPWKDEGWTDVREIAVYVDDDSESEAIRGLSIIYDKRGHPSDRVLHGIEEGKRESLKLYYPSEYLITISGYIQEDSGLTIIRSLIFHTNSKRQMTVGKEGGKKLSFPYTGGKIVGLCGSFKGSHLESIGAFYSQIPHTYPIRVFGPFGVEGEKCWDFDDINGIDVHFSDFIRCIDFKVDKDNTSSEPETNYGGNGRENTYKVKLGNGEYITSFAGYLDNVNGRGTRINSLTFQTNQRTWGPIGRDKGEPFSLPPESGMVVGFYGTSGGFLESIGARVKLLEPSEKLHFVPFVGLFARKDEKKRDHEYTHINVKKIIVGVDPSGEQRFVRSIAFEEEDKIKNLLRLKTNGSIDENEPLEVKEFVMASGEYLTSLSGYKSDDTTGIITSLTFQTNQRTIGPFGIEGGSYFSFPATAGKIVGFYWQECGQILHMIGARLEPIWKLDPIKSIGPFGRQGEVNWKNDKHIAVSKIEVKRDDGNGHRIRFCYYQRDWKQVWSEYYRFGTGEPYHRARNVTIDYPREYLTSICGVTSNDEQTDSTIIRSLTFYSNKATYGPYGNTKPGGQYFWYPSTRSRIIGFFGTCRKNKTLASIGVYAEPIPNFYPFKTVGPFGGSGGTQWDDGVHTDVRGFYIRYSNAISSIRIDYDNSGSFVLGSEHGVAGQNDLKKEIILKFPRERLLSVKGIVKQNGNTRITTVHNLQIFTTEDEYGPYGITRGLLNDRTSSEEFFISSETGDGRIVGFFGRVGSHLNSIGARLDRC